MMDYFDFNNQEWSTDDEVEGKTGLQTPIGTPIEKSVAGDISKDTTMSVSYAFHPYTSFDNLAPALVLISQDEVFFYVHHHQVLAASDNGFAMLLPFELSLDSHPPIVVMIPEPADVLNIILHTVYGLSAMEYKPSFETIAATLNALPRYGLVLKRYVGAGTPLYDLVAACASLRPIDTYALAAAHDLPDVAMAASAHLLSFRLSGLTDDLATRIGSVYLKKLFFLHFGRIEALKHLLLNPPSTHQDTPECSAAQQRGLTRAWALSAAHIMWEAGPNFSTHLLQAALLPLQKELTCPKCTLVLRDRIASLVIGWAGVKVRKTLTSVL
ncbi:uncharacterized protein B0H18DRAFT_1116571 [Fomitopsis serialis]|uniref:uncharacterized protein n=1 Tax=Fomitopsis serialis TaxID=139415 RepID=UPI00200884AF|nr:uncharacterized protein B0H18DRAFT_1116571 [Neoantrodia serialis]KAH9930863.1 hypothetical protein B0H18DRAFT_1116571 [Neoantrodia serialis]